MQLCIFILVLINKSPSFENVLDEPLQKSLLLLHNDLYRKYRPSIYSASLPSSIFFKKVMFKCLVSQITLPNYYFRNVKSCPLYISPSHNYYQEVHLEHIRGTWI